jgi:hypothetical protein
MSVESIELGVLRNAEADMVSLDGHSSNGGGIVREGLNEIIADWRRESAK